MKNLINIILCIIIQLHGYFKEAYSNLFMKIHLTSKITRYLTNIFKMRFLRRNCSKYAQHAKIEFLRKHVGQQRYPNQLYGSPPFYYVHIEIWGFPIITDADKHALQPWNLLDLKLGR